MAEDKYIIVNATALDRSGALSILKQFIANIPQEKQWLIFIPGDVKLSTDKENVRIEPIHGVKPMHKRLMWDAIGLSKWLKSHHISPIAAVSLQNTGFKVGEKVPQFIYYHQPLPFFPNKWNPLKANHLTFWLYKHIYPFFVNLFLSKDTKIFVQLDFIKKGFSTHFRHSPDKISVYIPSVAPPSLNENEVKYPEKLTLIYPAMPHFYKNHGVISDALKYSPRNLDIMFTVREDDMDNPHDIRIRYIGQQPQEKIWEMYKTCDALIFPSYIETFGLPLLEAAMTGLPILAADLPYAREVLKGYEGVTYVRHDDPQAWGKAMEKLEKGKRYPPIDVSARPSWRALFNYILKEIS